MSQVPHPVIAAVDSANAALFSGDWDAFAHAFADDVTIEDRRLGTRGIYTKQENIAQVKVILDLGVVSISTEFIEARDDRTALHRIMFNTESGFVVAALCVSEIDERGRVSRAVVFDENDLDSARVELERS